MHIVYDLRYAADHFTGIGTHAYCLLEAMLPIAGEDRFTVLWNPTLRQTRFDFRPFRDHPRVDWVERNWAPVSLVSLFQVGALLRERRPDVYLSPFYFLPFGAACPCVLTLHDVWPLRLPAGLKFVPRLFYQFALARAARARYILTSSEFSKREIVELSAMSSDQVRVVHLGVPATRGVAEPRRPASLPRDPFALVVGINKPHKNLPTLAEAWGRFGTRPPLRLVSCGPEDPRNPRLGPLAERHAAHEVTVLGRVHEDELEWLYRHATVLLFPTLYEGFGFPLLEAFTHGVAAIASDIPTLREVGEGAALFVDPKDPSAWAEAVTRIAGDPHLRARLQDAGTERAKEFHYARTARETLDVLRDARTPDVDPT